MAQVGDAGPAAAPGSSWRTDTGFFLGLLAVFLIVGQTRFFRDPGTFWHTVVGERILSTGHMVYTDPFSFTFVGRPWIAQQWLSECIMALVYRVSGLDGLLLLAAVILAGAYTWVVHRMRRAGLHAMLAIPVVVLIFLASMHHFHARPHLVTILLLGWTFARLSDFEAGRLSLPQLFWLVPLFLVWTNLHGGMLGGLLVTLLPAVVGWSVLWLLYREGPARSFRQVAALWGLVVACGLTALVNPYGTRLLDIWIYLSSPRVLPQYIQEHKPLDPTDVSGRCVLFFGAVYLGVLLTTLPRRPRVTWLIPLLWFVLACKSIRHGPLFAITAGMALADVIPHTFWARWLASQGTYLYVPRSEPAAVRWPGWRPAVVPVVVVLLAVGLQAGRIAVPLIGHGWARLDPTYWPLDLVPELRAPPDGTPIFNDMLYGGFLIRYAPNLRVFIDDRCELYGDDFLREYFEVAKREPELFDVWAEEYRFDWALVERDSGYDRYLEQAEDWTPVRREETETFAFYRRKTSQNTHSPAPRR